MLETFICIISILATCYLGDYIVFTALSGQETIIKALADSTIHGLVGFFSWLIIQKYPIYNAVICAIIAMLIDIDHFIHAQSFNIENAVNLTHRPFLHNSTLPLSIYIIVMFINCVLMNNYPAVKTYATLTFVAFYSHHLRDASRRGLWFHPWIESLPITYHTYIFADILLCLLFKIMLFDGNVQSFKLPVTIKDSGFS